MLDWLESDYAGNMPPKYVPATTWSAWPYHIKIVVHISGAVRYHVRRYHGQDPARRERRLPDKLGAFDTLADAKQFCEIHWSVGA